jgi:SAM-dependent methyltransferase
MPKLEMVKAGHLGGYIAGGDPGTWCPRLWSWAAQTWQVASVLDVGCGEGHSTRFFKELGCRVAGVEGCQQAIEASAVAECLHQHDFCDGPFLADEPFDMVWSCEFLEHVKPEFVPHILRTFAAARKAILVTHAFPGQEDGHHHVNCRPSWYWIEKIESLGFRCDPGLTRQARRVTLQDYAGINHFARSGLVFVRAEGAAPAGETVTGFWARLRTNLSARYCGFRIHQGFRWSAEYKEQVRRRKAQKRAEKRLRRSEAAGRESCD